MKQIRFQPLNETYYKLSTLLSKTALSIQTTDYTIQAAWAGLIQQVKQTYINFTLHATMEESLLFPLLHNYEPALVAILRDDQDKRVGYLSELSELFATMQAATDKHKSMLFSHKMLYRFDEFVASAVQQMKDHESMINEVLWRYYSDKELVSMAVSFNIVSSAPVRKQDFEFANRIINNIIPAAATTPASYKRNLVTNPYKQSHAPKELAMAI